MNPNDRSEDAGAEDTLSDEALDWIVRLNSGRATAADHAAFAEWRDQSIDHELAAREAEAIWQGIGTAGADVRRADEKPAGKLTRRRLLAGGGFAIAGFALADTLHLHMTADHVTGVGEQRTVALPDGSSVSLNAGSALSVAFSDGVRRLVLHEGQATFTVSHDGARPFIVEARGGQSLAVGTIFDVDMRPDEVVVTVIEGIVAVSTDVGPEPIRAALDEQITYTTQGPPSAAEPIDANSATAWRRGKLIFNGRLLADVAAEIERYRSGRIFVVGSRLSALQVTGVFDLGDPDAILRTIEETLPVTVTRLPLVTVIR